MGADDAEVESRSKSRQSPKSGLSGTAKHEAFVDSSSGAESQAERRKKKKKKKTARGDVTDADDAEVESRSKSRQSPKSELSGTTKHEAFADSSSGAEAQGERRKKK